MSVRIPPTVHAEAPEPETPTSSLFQSLKLGRPGQGFRRFNWDPLQGTEDKKCVCTLNIHHQTIPCQTKCYFLLPSFLVRRYWILWKIYKWKYLFSLMVEPCRDQGYMEDGNRRAVMYFWHDSAERTRRGTNRDYCADWAPARGDYRADWALCGQCVYVWRRGNLAIVIILVICTVYCVCNFGLFLKLEFIWILCTWFIYKKIYSHMYLTLCFSVTRKKMWVSYWNLGKKKSIAKNLFGIDNWEIDLIRSYINRFDLPP